jgi:hypothetical protein
MYSSITELKERCRSLGERQERGLSEKELSKKLAKIIVSLKILDDDAFEIAAEAYKEGRGTGNG